MAAVPKQKNLVLVVSAPSGAGKRTVLQRFREQAGRIVHTVSATTRPPRAGEQEGLDYYFLSAGEFERRVANGDFAECAEVHGNRYGTLRAELDRCLGTGNDVLLELDVAGMRSMRRLGYDVVSVFLMPPSLAELERRLRGRGTDSEDVIAVRLRNARAEIALRGEFDYMVVNEDISRAAGDIAAIRRAEHCRPARNVQEI